MTDSDTYGAFVIASTYKVKKSPIYFIGAIGSILGDDFESITAFSLLPICFKSEDESSPIIATLQDILTLIATVWKEGGIDSLSVDELLVGIIEISEEEFYDLTT